MTRMFPTRVGMNRSEEMSNVSISNVPHTRGDEPYKAALEAHLKTCSPHAWG